MNILETLKKKIKELNNYYISINNFENLNKDVFL